MLDSHVSTVIEKNKNMLVPYYIMAAYSYYVQDDPIISDSLYDCIGKELLKNFDGVEHYHKHLLDIDQLSAGTCLIKYPEIIKGAVSDLRKRHRSN